MKILTHNFWIKLFAVICATILWVYVSSSENKIADFPGSIPIEPKNIPSGLAPIYDQQRVKVKVQAPLEVWNRLNADTFEAYIDLTGLDKGTHEVEVKVVSKISNVLIIEKDPNKIIVRLEELLTKKVPVIVRFEGEVKKGFAPGEPEVIPKDVLISGAASLIEEVSEATAKVALTSSDEIIEKTVSVAVYDERGEKIRSIDCTPKMVKVKVSIIPASETKTVGIKVKTKGRPKPNYFISKIETIPATVEISGSESSLKSILFIETKEIDIEGLDKDIEREVELIIPLGITLHQKTVRVKLGVSQNTVEREIGATLRTTGTSLTVVSISPSVIKVIVSGPIDIINSLTASDVSITFNLSGKSAGSHLVNITKDMIMLPAGCVAMSWLPSAVMIVLE